MNQNQLNAKPVHTTYLTVRGYEIDSYGHVNNAVYVNYFEHARWAMFKDLDLVDIIHASKLFLVVTDLHVRYMRETRLHDELMVETRMIREGLYIIFKQKLINRHTGIPVSRGETKTVFIDDTRKPVDPPDEFIRNL